jgi:hypothetical protein
LKSDKTRQDKTRQDKTRQDKTRQGKARQDKTRQDKTRQDTLRQDKTRLQNIKDKINPHVRIKTLHNTKAQREHQWRTLTGVDEILKEDKHAQKSIIGSIFIHLGREGNKANEQAVNG